MDSTSSLDAPGRRITQRRGHKTYDALIRTAFKLLENREFDDITIAELARAAGYSVGAFYARFRSKDEFFDAMVVQTLKERARNSDGIIDTASDAELIETLMANLVEYFWRRRRFWRAALIRSTRDLDFWEPIRTRGRVLADNFVGRVSNRVRRPLTDTEDKNIRFAFQVALGTINNTIMNRPGPIFMEQTQFIDNLARTFRLVSDYDALLSDCA